MQLNSQSVSQESWPAALAFTVSVTVPVTVAGRRAAAESQEAAGQGTWSYAVTGSSHELVHVTARALRPVPDQRPGTAGPGLPARGILAAWIPYFHWHC